MKLLKKFFGLFKKKEKAPAKSIHQIHLEYIKNGFTNNLEKNIVAYISPISPIIDITIDKTFIWLHRGTTGITFSAGLGMYSTKEERDELITTLYETLEGSPLQARVFSQIMAQKLKLPLDDDEE